MTLVNKEVVQNKSVEELKGEGEFGGSRTLAPPDISSPRTLAP